MDTSLTPPPRRPLLAPALAVLALALAVLGWSIWETRYAWQSGYGNGELPSAAADPRLLTAGDMTTFHKGFKPFGQPADNLPWQYEKLFDDGDGLFDTPFKTASGRDPATSKPGDVATTPEGLGPLYNASGCGNCHFRDGAVAAPYQTGQVMNGIFLRMSVADGKGGYMAPPGYHVQLRDKSSAPGVPPEGQGVIDYVEVPGSFPDGERFSLRRPAYRVLDPGYGPLPEETIYEARSAPRLAGMGLLEALGTETLLALAKAQKNHPDGISGRPNWVIDPESGQRVIGKFSLKANEPHLRAQAAGAAYNDMGMTSPLHPQELCLPNQKECAAAPKNGGPGHTDLSEAQIRALTVYLQLLAVPARRDIDDPAVQRGERLFADAGCAACHVPTLTTDDSHPIRRLRRQTIHPYSDLLLHDMGPGLSGRPDGEASAQEWRTPPLWGQGLTQKSNHHTVFLHDQRARNLQEAILWHDGEAAIARSRFMGMKREDRAALLRFLESI
ncbi:MAG: c-type cytochrome [Dechloromonas sp.]|nr:MAG: c-type cytochrome [Dechloromonas sp.]